jgi:hypothetical protein
MAKPKTNFTELAHQVVRDSAVPLAMDEIVARVQSLAGGETTKNLKNTIRAAISQSTAIIYTPEGSYGWKSHLLNGAVLRATISEDTLAERELILDDLQRDMLQPNGPGSYKYGVAGLPRLELVGGPTLEVGPIPRPFDDDLLSFPDPFWEWLDAQGARPGDSLLLTAIDVDARRYSLSYEPVEARDEEAITARSQEVIAAAVRYVRHSKGRTTVWDLASHLTVSGLFHQIPAPLPFHDLWTSEVWGPLVDEYDVSPLMLGGRDDAALNYLTAMLDGGMSVASAEPAGPGTGPIFRVGDHGTYQGDLGVSPELLQARIDAIFQHPNTPVPNDDPLLLPIIAVFSSMALPSPTGSPYLASQLVQLFGDDEEILDWIDHGAELGMVQIDPAYETMFDEGDDSVAPIPEPQARSGESRTLVLRVSYRYKPEFWREIEIADDQYLSDLHLAIQRALGWDNDHLYSFYTGKRPYDEKTEIGAPGAHARRRADAVTVGALELRTRQKFLYLFDFGDDHLFDIQVMKINPKAPPGIYPRVVGQQGDRLIQYEGEEEWDDDWNEDEELDAE